MGCHQLKFRFCLPDEDLGGVYMDDNYLAIRHDSGVIFSFCRRGNAVMAHFSANKDSIRSIKDAIDDFCEWAFDFMPWATMIMATIERPSVVRLVKKCAFKPVCKAESKDIYMRNR